MKTSGLLFDESGNRIENWCGHFSVIPHPEHPDDAAMATVVYSFLIDEQLEKIHETTVKDFVQIIERPFEIEAADCLYVNRDVIYENNLIDNLLRFSGATNTVPVALMPFMPSELAGAGLMLDRKALDAFERGQPIWRRGAVSCKPSRGMRGRSGASDLLRSAILAWAVISEQAIRHAFKLAKGSKKTFQHRHTDVSDLSLKLVQYHLGYDEYGNCTKIPLIYKSIDDVQLVRFKYQTTIDESRKEVFSRSSGKRSHKKPLFSGTPESISRQQRVDLENFGVLNPNECFDAYAIAEWSLDVLLWLRLAYTLTTSLDNDRSSTRLELSNASNFDERTHIARQFSYAAFHRVKGTRRANGRSQTVTISHMDMMGSEEAALIAFLANLDPRAIHPQLHPFFEEDQNALFDTARWFGVLYRERRNILTYHQAKLYVYIIEKLESTDDDNCHDENSDFAGILFAYRMFTSFITVSGILRLQEVARATIADGVSRSVFAISPDYDQMGEKFVTAPKCAEQTEGQRLRIKTVIPHSVLIPAGRLLIPGDYAENRAGRRRTFFKELQNIQ